MFLEAICTDHLTPDKQTWNFQTSLGMALDILGGPRTSGVALCCSLPAAQPPPAGYSIWGDKVEADASRCLWAGLSGSKLIYSWGWRMGIEFLVSQTAQHFQESRSQDVSPGCHFNFHGNQTNEAEHTCTILQSRLLPHSCSAFAQASKYLLFFVFIYLEKATFPPKVIHASWLRAELTRSVLPPLSVLIILLGWWQGPLLKQLIFFFFLTQRWVCLEFKM